MQHRVRKTLLPVYGSSSRVSIVTNKPRIDRRRDFEPFEPAGPPALTPLDRRPLYQRSLVRLHRLSANSAQPTLISSRPRPLPLFSPLVLLSDESASPDTLIGNFETRRKSNPDSFPRHRPCRSPLFSLFPSTFLILLASSFPRRYIAVRSTVDARRVNEKSNPSNADRSQSRGVAAYRRRSLRRSASRE